jgi:hypothetical protein
MLENTVIVQPSLQLVVQFVSLKVTVLCSLQLTVQYVRKHGECAVLTLISSAIC